jgi:hypothetical protein
MQNDEFWGSNQREDKVVLIKRGVELLKILRSSKITAQVALTKVRRQPQPEDAAREYEEQPHGECHILASCANSH